MGNNTKDEVDRSIRNSIIAVVVSLVIFVVIVGVWKINSTAASQEGDVIPAQYSSGEPIVVSNTGVGESNSAVPDVDLYFSYTCHACAQLENEVGDELVSGAESGRYNLVLHPVNTASAPFQGPATSAALVVAADAPEHFVAFNHALLEFFWSQFQLKNNDIVGNLEASTEQVAKIAHQVGVPPAVVDQFGTGATEYLKQSTADWKRRQVEGRERTATPEVVVDDHAIVWTDPTELISALP